MRKKIEGYTQSKVTDIKIKYDGEVFRFNLGKELSINQDRLNDELISQPSYYGFLIMLQNKLLIVKEDKERIMEKTFAKEFKKLLSSVNPNTNRNYSEKLAKELVLSSDNYDKTRIQFIKAKSDYLIMVSAVRAFEQRSSLVQTLSANTRSERF